MPTGPDNIAQLLAQGQPRRGRWIWAALLALALAGASGWAWQSQTSSSGTIRYSTEAVAKGDLTVTVTATGTVQPTTQVEVSSELSGKLATVDVDFNDAVTVGQVLATLDSTKLAAQTANATAQMASASARVTQAEASAREAAATLITQQELSAKGLGTRKDLVSFEVADERARAAIAIARADLTLAEANLALVSADLEKAVIRSPIQGVVLDRAAEAGQIVASSLQAPVLFTLAEDLTHMQLLVDIDEADIGKVAVGDAASFTVDAYDGMAFPATITQVRFAPEITDQVVTYKAVLSVENPDQLLRPGMTATAVITVDQVQAALVVPNAALRYAPPSTASTSSRSGLLGLIMPGRSAAKSVATGKSLWVLRDGAPVEIPVSLIATDGRATAVTGEDLAEADLVITDQTTGAN